MNSLLKLNWRLIAFYLGVPVLLPLYTSLHNWEFQQVAGYSGTAAFYLAHSMIPWWLTCLSTYAVMRLLAHWKPAPVLIMIIGSIFGCAFAYPYTIWVSEAFLAIWPLSENAAAQLHVGTWSGHFFNYVLRAVLVWLAVNYIFDRFVGLPRYRYKIPRGYESQAEPSTEETEQDENRPAFLSRLPVNLHTEAILAIKAEQHYIRIITPERDHMILYRFSDAVSQLDADLGMQVHRSWWIAHPAIESLQQAGKKLFIILSTGEEVPVSSPYQGLIKELARTKALPIRPIPQKPAVG